MSSWKHWLGSPAPYILIIMFPTLLYLDTLLQRSYDVNYRAEERNRVLYAAGEVRASLEQRIYSTIYISQAIQSLVALKPDLDQTDLSRAVAPLVRSQGAIRNIGLAPGMVVRMVYPITGNEAAIGLDYRNTPEQYPTALLARERRNIVLAGPLDLVQGGLGIIARVPIFFTEGPRSLVDDEGFWGLASVVLDADILFRGTGLADIGGSVAYALRGRDGQGMGGEVFLGDAALFDRDPVLLNIQLPQGLWVLAAAPRDGWTTTAPGASAFHPWFRAIALLTLIMMGFMVFLVAQLRLARQEALDSSATKSGFLASMSHEIRTPLNAVLGYTGLLVQTPLDTEQTQYARNAQVAGRALMGVINDILDFSKIEAGKLDLELTHVNLGSLVDETLDIIGYQARLRGLDLGKEIDGNLPSWVIADSVRLQQILLNLLGNAVKFTERGGVRLRIYGRTTSPRWWDVEFQVIDTGIGMSPQEINRVFSAFSQADPSTSRRFGGTGLGLHISQRLARLMDSRILVASSPGRGSTFSFTLRLAEAPPPAEQVYRPTESPARSWPPASILVVEDVPLNMTLIKALLRRIHPNFVLVEATQGQEAIQAYLEHHPDLVLMDVQMPVLDGLSACKRIRELEGSFGRRVPVVALSAGALAEEEQAAIRAGMDAFLTKPVDPALLERTLEVFLLGSPGARIPPAPGP